jgi:CRP-like cAMP-binding protein
VTIPTAHQARAHAERAISEDAYARALGLYCAVLDQLPDDLDARLRVADCLLALGEAQSAAAVYTTLARHAAHAGHPLYAIIAIKVLTALDAALASLAHPLAELYAADSGRVGASVRATPPDEAPLSPELVERYAQLTPEALVQAAAALGADDARLTRAYPPQLPPLPLLSSLDREAFVQVLGALLLVRKRAGQTLIVQGEPATSFFIAARGDLRVFRSDANGVAELATLHEGALCGEMALVSNSPRGATVEALSSADALECPVAALAELSRGAGTIAAALTRFTQERLLLNLINTAPLFRPLDRDQRIDLVRRFTAHEVAPSTDVIREGERVPGLYIVLQGAFDVVKRDGDEKVLLATLRGGEVFGELSLLGDTPASATVSAAERSVVLLLAREYVERVMESVPAVRAYLERLGDERAMETQLWLDDGAFDDAG